MKIYKYIIILIVMMACDKSKSNTNLILKSDFFKEIDTYINKNPLKPPVYKNIYNKGFSYPSYHIYFNRKDNDTIMSIIQSSHLSNIEIDGTYDINNKDEIFYNVIKSDGLFWYKGKYPLILFNSEFYTKENLKKHLTQDIPDSLKYNKKNYHIKPNRWDYKIKNNKIIRIDLDNNFRTHPKTK